MTIFDSNYQAIDTFELRSVDDEVDDGEDFDFSESRTVEIDNEPWADAFDTDTFHKVDYKVTGVAEQPYVIDGDEYTFTKPRSELQQAQWRIDNLPWTLEHPGEKQVTRVDEARGFWRRPRYDEGSDEQLASLYIPANDGEALEYASEHEGVSVGFRHRLQRPSEYDGTVGGTVDMESVDGLQTDIYYDHIATVSNPRFNGSGRVASDALPTDEGDGEVPTHLQSDGAGMARAVDTISEDAIYPSVRRDPRPHEDELAEVEIDPQVSDGNAVEVARATASVPFWICVHQRGDSYRYHTPSLSSSLGEAGPYDPNTLVEEETISLDEPLREDTEVYVTLHYTDASGNKEGHILGDRDFVSDETTVILDDSIDSVTTTDLDDYDNNFDTNMSDPDISDLTVDSIAEQNDEVAELKNDKSDLEDTVDTLEDEKGALKSELDSVKDELNEYRSAEKEQLVDSITDITDYWDEDELMEKDAAELREKKNFVDEELADEEPTTPSTDNEDEPPAESDSFESGEVVDLTEVRG